MDWMAVKQDDCHYCLQRHDSSGAFIVLFVEVESGSRWNSDRIAASMLVSGVEGLMETETPRSNQRLLMGTYIQFEEFPIKI